MSHGLLCGKTKYISKSAKLVTGQTNKQTDKQTNFYLTFWDKLSLLRSSYKFNIEQYVPTSFTIPTLAKVERIWTPTHYDIAENPWIPILWHGEDDNSHLTV